MSDTSQDTYEAVLIRHGDGNEIDPAASAYLTDCGYHFDEVLGGFVVSAAPGNRISLPASFTVFLPLYGLACERVAVDYNPEWFSLPDQRPVWGTLLAPWDGRPPVIGGVCMQIVWFLSPNHNDGRPFMATWGCPGDAPETWRSSKGGDFSPGEALAHRWQVLASMKEVGMMGNLRIDRGHAARLGKAAMEAIVRDIEGHALQVGIETGRILKASVVEQGTR